LVDPEGLWVAQVVGIVLGAGVNAYKNWDSLQSGRITAGQFWESVAVGAATGLLSSLGGGIVSGAFLGGTASFLNSIGDQFVTGSPCDNVNLKKAFVAGGLGVGAGILSGSGALLGRDIVQLPEPIYIPGGELFNYGEIGGIVGNIAGTALTK
jgi:hypothetical protein